MTLLSFTSLPSSLIHTLSLLDEAHPPCVCEGGRAICFSESSHSHARLFQKHPPRHTQK